MKAEIKNGNLILTIPIEKKLEASKSGKTLTVATTNGFKDSGIKHNDKPLMVSLNAYIKP